MTQINWKRLLGLIPLKVLVVGYQFVLPIDVMEKGANWIQMVLTWLVLFASIGLYLYLGHKYQLIDFSQKLKAKPLFKAVGLGWLGFLVVGVLSTVVGNLEGVQTTTNQAAIMELFGVLPAWFLYPMLTLAAPVMEELFYRGFLMRAICPDKPLVGLMISSLAFGIFHHITSLSSAIIYIGMGLVLGLVAQRTKRLEYSMALHFFQNNLAFVAIQILRHFGDVLGG